MACGPCSFFRGTFQLGDAASQQGKRALVPIENRFHPRRLDVAAFKPKDDAVQNQQLVLDPAEPALDPLEPIARLTSV